MATPIDVRSWEIASTLDNIKDNYNAKVTSLDAAMDNNQITKDEIEDIMENMLKTLKENWKRIASVSYNKENWNIVFRGKDFKEYPLTIKDKSKWDIMANIEKMNIWNTSNTAKNIDSKI